VCVCVCVLLPVKFYYFYIYDASTANLGAKRFMGVWSRDI